MSANFTTEIVKKLHDDAINSPDRVIYNFLNYLDNDFSHHEITIKELWDRSANIAGELLSKGAKKGDRAIILCMQDEGTVYAIWGCIIAGVTFTVIPPPIDSGKVSRFISVLRSCSPKFLISNKEKEKEADTNLIGSLLKGALKEVLTLKRIYTDRTKSHPEVKEPVVHGPEDLIYLQYTSGSTSESKGVMVTHKNLMACINQCLEFYDFTVGSYNLCSWVPFFHNIGLIIAIFLPIVPSHGVSYFISTLEFLRKPTIWIKALSDFKINITAAPNSAYEVITQLISSENAKEYDLSHMVHLLNGSEFVSPHTVNKFCKLFGISPDVFTPGYGLSECVCVACVANHDFRVLNIDADEYRQGRFIPISGEGKTVVSVGKLSGDSEIRTVRKDGSLCGENEIGELYMRGSTICAGYYKNEEETKKFHAKIEGIDGDFFRTGDMGYIFEGNIYLTGRIKEMIVVSGKNLFPNDIISAIEHLDTGLPTDSMAVFSIQQNGIEAPIICSEIRDPGMNNVKAKDIMHAINKKMVETFDFAFKDIVFVENGKLPRTDNRKIKTIETKRLYKDNLLKGLYSLLSDRDDTNLVQSKVTIDTNFSKDSSVENIKTNLRILVNNLLPGIQINDTDSFLELGADSLTMARLVTILEQKTNVPVDLRQIIEDPSINGISQYIYKKLLGETESLEEHYKKLYSDAVLPEHMTISGEYSCRPSQCKNVFLTGASGFLGAYLIKALIEEHGPDICIYAHVRADSIENGNRRIAENLKRFNCFEAKYMDCIIPVLGDLTSPNMGIDEKIYSELSHKIDIVIHNGAILNFLLSYNKLKDANVGGTLAALEFAMAGRPKYFEYISSYSVYDTPNQFKKKVSEDDPLEKADGYFLGYSETKWVSEKLVQDAVKRGLKAVVFRPGDITGTVKDGIWKLEDLISRSIVGCIQLGAVPEMDVHLHLTPVDYVAKSISHIAFQDESIGHGFNIINNFTRPISELSRFMNKLGYKTRVLPYEEWCQELVSKDSAENVLRVLSCLFTDKKPTGENLHERYGEYQAEFSDENCQRLLSGTDITCPPMSNKMLYSYLLNFYRAGYIKKPSWFITLFLGDRS